MERGVESGTEVRLLDLVFAVSEAMDLVCPEVGGHHKRVATIASAIARQFGLPPDRLRDVVIAAALHDSGAFSLKERLDLLEFEETKPGEHADAGYRLLRTFRYFARPAAIVRHHHLPWDGGRGEAAVGEAVPLESHLLHLADRISVLVGERADIFAQGEAIRRTIDRSSGSRFKPELVQAFHAAAASESFWLDAVSTEAAFPDKELLGSALLTPADLKGVARLLWQLVDFRSRFTATHTSGVAAVAGALGRLAGMSDEDAARLSIAAGLHDLGKLAVPVEVLEKERPLNRHDRVSILGHPYYGYHVLDRVPGLQEINRWASYHHERLDGGGYPFHRSGAELSLGCRVVCVADVFTALSEERPYRRGLSGRESMTILSSMVRSGALDADLVGLVEGNRETCDAIRHLAQERAAERYLAFREHLAA